MELKVTSTKNKEVIDMTDKINSELESNANGAVLIFVKHTTAAVAISEVGEGTEEDFALVVEKLIPKIDFRHGHNPAHAPDHMISSIIGQSLTVPVRGGQLDLGTWQKVVILEENGPRSLNISLTLI